MDTAWLHACPFPYQERAIALSPSYDVGHGQDWTREKVERAVVKMSPTQTEIQMALFSMMHFN